MDEDIVIEIHYLMLAAAKKEREIARIYQDIAALGGKIPDLYDPVWWSKAYERKASNTEIIADWWIGRMVEKGGE